MDVSDNKPITVRIVVVGGAGNVGAGVCDACSARSDWDVINVDHASSSSRERASERRRGGAATEEENIARVVVSTVEDVDEEVFRSWFVVGLDESRGRGGHVEFVVTNDDGNRDAYARDPTLGVRNNARYASLIRRIATAQRRLEIEATSTHVSYVGGSWTRRRPRDDNRLVVDDASPAKPGGGSNPYERAKTDAERNARESSLEHGVPTTFYDYASVVPNLSPNFSVNRMVVSGLEDGVIRFSPGDEFGRPLLHSARAGEFVARAIEKRIASLRRGDDDVSYETVLVPGDFVPFRTFANVAKEVVERYYGDDGRDVSLETYDRTPNELRTRCVSSSSREFASDYASIHEGLKEAATHTLLRYFENKNRPER